MKADKVGDVTMLRSSQGNHTPGPWIANGLGGVFGGAATGLIAQVTRTANPDVMVADARLIAAAPELLEALQGILDAADNALGIWTPMVEPFKVARAILSKVAAKP